MKSLLSMQKFFLVALLNLMLAASAFAAGPTKDEAKALVEKAVARIKEVGTEKAFAEFNTNPGPWVKGELYILAYDYQGKNLVLGSNPKMNGKNLWDAKTPDGKMVVQEFVNIAKTKGTGWFDYQWNNPETKKIADKSTYLAKVPGMDAVIGCGIYND